MKKEGRMIRWVRWTVVVTALFLLGFTIGKRNTDTAQKHYWDKQAIQWKHSQHCVVVNSASQVLLHLPAELLELLFTQLQHDPGTFHIYLSFAHRVRGDTQHITGGCYW